MTIHIEELTFDCIIGILNFERVTPQRVIINLTINYNYQENNFINYADVISSIETQMTEKKYQLLETAIDEVGKHLLTTYPHIKSLNLKITKPDIISNAKVSLSKNLFKTPCHTQKHTETRNYS